ncbi:hypothetical protein CHLRE_16g668837v5 [Chlamydomonas reinhardtii]|uniref:Uncharacterized protein n=1 Tax=Chlamydomonas reinhardtii TaxID=3055 RepID=A0A2K3CTY0_CHLRE|nr:uncharacterized protein CHLRE_16g668837v5 [Chlamydomonas reinhardtii]PNW71740.1 hypothetical protein CHLRE_16g668837v5 [Chlamydomonas reinhardtii]
MSSAVKAALLALVARRLKASPANVREGRPVLCREWPCKSCGWLRCLHMVSSTDKAALVTSRTPAEDSCSPSGSPVAAPTRRTGDAPAPAGLPARLAAAVGHVRSAGVEQHPPQPATQPPAAPPQWRVSLDQLWVANAAGAVSYVHYTGRLLEPGPGVLPPAVDGAWQPACVLQHRKPRHLWTFEERAAYNAASPGERAGAWPRAPYFLAPEAGVVVHPEHCRIPGVSLADYMVRDVRRAITAANPAAPPAPARPAAMPCLAPAQQAGGPGTQPAAQSRLAEREAEWQRAAVQLTTTAAQHFHNNPVALDPWLHRTSAAAAAAAAAVEGDPRMPPPDASLLRGRARAFVHG